MAKSSFHFTAWQSAYIASVTKAVQEWYEHEHDWNKTVGFDIQILASDVETEYEPGETSVMKGRFKNLLIQFHPRSESVPMSVARSVLEGELFAYKKSCLGFTYYEVDVTQLTWNGEIVG